MYDNSTLSNNTMGNFNPEKHRSATSHSKYIVSNMAKPNYLLVQQ